VHVKDAATSKYENSARLLLSIFRPWLKWYCCKNQLLVFSIIKKVFLSLKVSVRLLMFLFCWNNKGSRYSSRISRSTDSYFKLKTYQNFDGITYFMESSSSMLSKVWFQILNFLKVMKWYPICVFCKVMKKWRYSSVWDSSDCGLVRPQVCASFHQQQQVYCIFASKTKLSVTWLDLKSYR
jgi:hypothetical protein